MHTQVVCVRLEYCPECRGKAEADLASRPSPSSSSSNGRSDPPRRPSRHSYSSSQGAEILSPEHSKSVGSHKTRSRSHSDDIEWEGLVSPQKPHSRRGKDSDNHSTKSGKDDQGPAQRSPPRRSTSGSGHSKSVSSRKIPSRSKSEVIGWENLASLRSPNSHQGNDRDNGRAIVSNASQDDPRRNSPKRSTSGSGQSKSVASQKTRSRTQSEDNTREALVSPRKPRSHNGTNYDASDKRATSKERACHIRSPSRHDETFVSKLRRRASIDMADLGTSDPCEKRHSPSVNDNDQKRSDANGWQEPDGHRRQLSSASATVLNASTGSRIARRSTMDVLSSSTTVDHPPLRSNNHRRASLDLCSPMSDSTDDAAPNAPPSPRRYVKRQGPRKTLSTRNLRHDRQHSTLALPQDSRAANAFHESFSMTSVDHPTTRGRRESLNMNKSVMDQPRAKERRRQSLDFCPGLNHSTSGVESQSTSRSVVPQPIEAERQKLSSNGGFGKSDDGLEQNSFHPFDDGLTKRVPVLKDKDAYQKPSGGKHRDSENKATSKDPTKESIDSQNSSVKKKSATVTDDPFAFAFDADTWGDFEMGPDWGLPPEGKSNAVALRVTSPTIASSRKLSDDRSFETKATEDCSDAAEWELSSRDSAPVSDARRSPTDPFAVGSPHMTTTSSPRKGSRVQQSRPLVGSRG